MKKKNVHVALVQMSCSPDPEENMTKVEQEIRAAADQGAQIICLQELFRSLYFCDVEDYHNFALAESIPGPTTDRFSALAKELELVIIASLFEKRTAGIYHNTTAVIDADGSYLGKYRKMHIPDDPGYFEKFYFTPGDMGYKVFDTKYAKVGVLICWDQWYPEAARLTAMKGADFLFYPTAIGWHKDQDEQTNAEQLNAWQTIQKSHSVANGIPVVSVNRTGIEGDMKFWGNSFVTNSFGYVTYQAPSSEEVTKVVALNLNETDEKRTHWPFFRDRRIDSYAPITKRFLDDDESH
ncbi:MAG: carbon-nitrogen hydrolase [bacterium]|nr:carbon-nitrogen hydrolase [bacterium]